MARKRSQEHGVIVGGRLQLDRQTREVIRTYSKCKLWQARKAYELAKAAHSRLKCEQTKGRLADTGRILSFWENLYAQGQHSVCPVEWAAAWTDVTTHERHVGSEKPNQNRIIPGME
jgi:hypothetical protein